MSIHDLARRGFQREAEAYERGRPDYPAQAIEWLTAALRLASGRRVVDVGAGTGKLSRALLPSGAEVVAVEPIAAMRRVLSRDAADLRVVGGTAERLPFGDGIADAVAAGQAFHWFDGPVALAEFHRVLRGHGRLGLIWNRRALQQPLQRAISELIEPFRGGAPSHESGLWRQALETTDLFWRVGENRVAFEQRLDADQLVDRVGSTSFIAALEPPERHEVLARVRHLARHGPTALAYVCETFVFERRPYRLSAPTA